ncbi:MAG: SGNH/GDSL hydrolase family protein [Burkholderiales bacterium]|nr:MAG: SGNH/GDSL hydrolase family protein [Burkholderiales bacterium]
MPNFYWDEHAMQRDGESPTILAIGDSWFWYPLLGGSLVNTLGRVVQSVPHTIFAKGMNGAEAFDYVDGKYAESVEVALHRYGAKLEAVFISGGGNDFAGFNDLRPLLGDNCSAQVKAEGCFGAGLDRFLKNMDKYYRKLIGVIYTHTKLPCKIVMHTYAYAIPDGRGLLGSSKWLKPALEDAQVPAHLHQACVKYLLDRFHEMLTAICANDPEHLLLVDSRNALAPEDWANELHPTGQGFEKLAELYWRPVLEKAKLALPRTNYHWP